MDLPCGGRSSRRSSPGRPSRAGASGAVTSSVVSQRRATRQRMPPRAKPSTPTGRCPRHERSVGPDCRSACGRGHPGGWAYGNTLHQSGAGSGLEVHSSSGRPRCQLRVPDGVDGLMPEWGGRGLAIEQLPVSSSRKLRSGITGAPGRSTLWHWSSRISRSRIAASAGPHADGAADS